MNDDVMRTSYIKATVFGHFNAIADMINWGIHVDHRDARPEGTRGLISRWLQCPAPQKRVRNINRSILFVLCQNSGYDSYPSLRVSYVATYRVSIAEPGGTESGKAVAAMRAPEGERPGAIVAVGSVTTIEGISVSEDGSLVSFRDEAGRLDSMTVLRD